MSLKLLLIAAPAAALLLAACASPMATTPSYPHTRTVAQVDTYHSTAVPDPFRWLEDDNAADTKAWVQAQNAVTERYLAALLQREPVRRIYTSLHDFEKIGVPTREGGRWFWTRNSGLQPQAVLYTAPSPDAEPTVALDPNTFSADGTVAISGFAPSRDGRYLAYGTAGAGSDWQRWQVRDLTTGQDLPDRLEWVKFSSAKWTPDGRGFFYCRYAEPRPGMALSGVNEFQKLYYHRLGSPQSADVLVAENPNDKRWGFVPEVSDDGRWVTISVWRGSGRESGLLVLPLAEGGALGDAKPQPVLIDFDASYTVVDVVGRKLVLFTDRDAPNGRLVAVDIDDPSRSEWKTLVAETGDALQRATAVGGRYVLHYLRDASSLVRVHGADHALLREVALPGVGSAGGFAGKPDSSVTYFSYTSAINPPEVWRYDVATGEARLWRRPKTAFDPDRFETRREFVTSKDGTRFPVFISHRKGLARDGSNPTLLYGYGGFNIPMTPSYGATAATWLQMGGVYVTAAIRGGGEYGAPWHQAGTKLRKQNVFDDFIAAAEWLVAQKVTRPDRLAINGGSNGGLLVGAVVNQRPELFGAAVPQVGVMDMLRFHKFTIGWAWVGDYGSSDDAAEFAALLKYSPLHNIRAGVRYPPILVTTADHDDRVVPAHSFKYAAQLQATSTGPAPKLIRVETSAGHGAGKPTAKLIEERSDMLAFVAGALQMDVH